MGIDPMRLPIQRFVALTYHLRVRNLDQKERRNLDMALYKVPKGERPSELADPLRNRKEEMNIFAAAMAQQKAALAPRTT